MDDDGVGGVQVMETLDDFDRSLHAPRKGHVKVGSVVDEHVERALRKELRNDADVGHYHRGAIKLHDIGVIELGQDHDLLPDEIGVHRRVAVLHRLVIDLELFHRCRLAEILRLEYLRISSFTEQIAERGENLPVVDFLVSTRVR